MYRRNRRDLRKTKEQIQKDLCEPSFEDDQSDMDTHEPTIEANKETVSSPSHKQSAKPDVQGEIQGQRKYRANSILDIQDILYISEFKKN